MLKYGLMILALTTCFASIANDKNDKTNPVIIADTINQPLSLSPKQVLIPGQDTSNEIKINHLGAAFIKVHFNYFNLPAGAYVVVSDAQGTESYVYDGTSHNHATFNGEAGEDGINQFSAMSVFGDTAIVKLVMPTNAQWEAKHGIKIDRFNAGYDTAITPANKVNDVSPESTCGVNERRDVACWVSSHPTQYERTRPVARLLMNGSGLCTGWRVSDDNYMFTNEHCVSSQSELTNTEVWFNYQNTTCGGSTKAGTVKVTGKDLVKLNYTLDYTLFTVNNFDTIKSFGNFGLETRLPTQGELIYIAQHGAGNPKELAIESDQNSNGLCQIDIATTGGRGTNTDTGYFCDTIGGSSGSPVIAGSSNRVIALHHFGGCENQGVQMYKIWPEVSSYFGGVPPVGDGGTGNENNPPYVEASIQCEDRTCSFDSSNSYDSDGQIISYLWEFGDGSTSSESNPTHTYENYGSYTATLTVTDDDDASSTASKIVSVTSSNNELSSGVPVTGLSAAKDGKLDYFINTTETNSVVKVDIDGGTGDADLYVNVGSEATKSNWDCRPYRSGNVETCTVSVPSPDSVHIALIAYNAFSDVSLVANVSKVSDDGFPKVNLAATKGDWLRYTYNVPQGVSQLEINISGGTGDADLYVQKDVEPSQTIYDCRPFQSGNTESCTISVTQGDEIHIGVRAYSSFSGLTLDVN